MFARSPGGAYHLCDHPKGLTVHRPVGDLADARPPAYYGKPLRVITSMVSPLGDHDVAAPLRGALR